MVILKEIEEVSGGIIGIVKNYEVYGKCFLIHFNLQKYSVSVIQCQKSSEVASVTTTNTTNVYLESEVGM